MNIRLNLAAGDHPLPGFVNLDKVGGWTFESGLREYADESVEAVGISHGLMYVRLGDWPAVFAEFARVLEPGGVIRITEDATDVKGSERYGGYHDAVTLTTSALVAAHLERVGLRAYVLFPDETLYRDRSLIQTWHGEPPKIFFCEGVKP